MDLLRAAMGGEPPKQLDEEGKRLVNIAAMQMLVAEIQELEERAARLLVPKAVKHLNAAKKAAGDELAFMRKSLAEEFPEAR